MLLRAIALSGFLCLPFLSGCLNTCHVNQDAYGPPRPRLGYLLRLTDEVQWFYADLQDVFFGIDYYCELEHKYGAGPYD